MPGSQKKNYRDQIRAALSQTGWEVLEIDHDTDWWVDEHWTISSTTQAYGHTLVVSFLVDPMYEGPNKSAAIWTVLVGKTRPEDRLDTENMFAELDMTTGHFAEKLDEFIRAINQYRDTLSQ